MAIEITYFVHGSTTDNENQIANGWPPGQLSEKGRREARELGSQASDQPLEIVFCSDLQRAVDSAELAFGGRYQIIKDARLRECDLGDLNGMAEEQLQRQYPTQAYIDQPFPNGESCRDVERRVAAFLEDLRLDYDGKHVGIMAHQIPQLALEVLLNGKTWPQAIQEDWRQHNAWQPGWRYTVKDIPGSPHD